MAQADEEVSATGGDEGAQNVGYTLDLSKLDQAPEDSSELVNLRESAEFERKIRGRQEWVRTSLAVGAFLSLVLILGLLLGAVFTEISAENIEQVATVVVTPLTGIVGTIIGFYFAERRNG